MNRFWIDTKKTKLGDMTTHLLKPEARIFLAWPPFLSMLPDTKGLLAPC